MVAVDPADAAPKQATAATVAANRRAGAAAWLDDPSDRDRAERGRVAEPSSPQVLRDGFPVWDLDAYAFVTGPAPETVHPGLWRQASLNNTAGLFEVAPGFHQVRGLDLSNLTVIEGAEGRIVIDPLTSANTARAALDLVEAHLGARRVTAVIYTHSHVDHFAGIHGVIDEADVDAGRVRVIAPAGFLHAAISENVVAGTAMTRRASYMYGALLPRSPLGHVDAGLGKGVPLFGRQGLVAPTEDVDDHGDRAGGGRRPHRLPGHAGHRGARGDELPLPRPPRAVHGRELHLHAPQPVHAARRPGARRAGVEQVPERGDRPVRRGQRRALRQPPLAPLGRATTCSSTSRPSATSTATCTTRRCGWPTRAGRWSRRPRSSSCRRRSPTRRPAGATTAPSTTT